MITRSEVRRRITVRLINGKQIPLPRIDLPNKPFDVPPAGSGPWCRIRFSDGTSEQRSLGGAEVNARFERQARFRIQVFTDQGTGTATCLDIAESIADLYEKQTGDRPVYYLSPNVSESDGMDPNGWYMCTVSVQYLFSICK